jgi:hypothetical protein
MTSRFSLTLKDFDSEKSSCSFRVEQIDDTNFATIDGLIDTLKTAIQGISVGVEVTDQRTYAYDTSNLVPPLDQGAQRELKWLVRYTDDTTGEFYRVEVPVADTSLLDNSSPDPNTRKSLPLDAGAGQTFKDAFEAVVVSPDGNATSVQQVILVGRSL